MGGSVSNSTSPVVAVNRDDITAGAYYGARIGARTRASSDDFWPRSRTLGGNVQAATWFRQPNDMGMGARGFTQIAGVVKNSSGSVLAGATVKLYATNADAPTGVYADQVMDTVVSATDGAYAASSFLTKDHYVVGYLPGTQDAAGSSINTLDGKTASNPRVLFVEGIAGMGRAGYGLPTGIASYPDGTAYSGFLLVAGITGAAGATNVTINTGTVADMAGIWAACVTHDNGKMRAYTVRDASGGTCNLYPPLEFSCTNTRMVNLHSTVNGQHFTSDGFKCFADYIYDYDPDLAYRGKFHAQQQPNASNGIQGAIGDGFTAWQLYGGQGSGRTATNFATNIEATVALNGTQYNARNPLIIQCAPGAAGHGTNLTWTFTTARTGIVDIYASSIGVDFTTSLPIPVSIAFYVNNSLVQTTSVPQGLQRVTCPVTAATTVEIRATMAGRSDDGFYLGAATFWATPTGSLQASMFPIGSKVVILGDSWGTYYSNAWENQLDARIAAAGAGSSTTVAVDGVTAMWGIQNFDTIVTPLAPTHVIIEFAINDMNGGVPLATWISHIEVLIKKTLAINAIPVVILPFGTSSISQAQVLATWAATSFEGWLKA